ncbi:uncharacterized protein QC763_710420 [Podospora pseudopauciseta]|uniref:Uncharacterized protein n=2 Tax=Podospora TaxID=5144 RepID=A0ABR0H2G0_9PEZI|nr:hypothetical protein QC763_710420 [Podospora pseudopauciseta]KAK4668771.1 hypothetical protein QC764_710420 [Podospora pseudoanserina]
MYRPTLRLTLLTPLLSQTTATPLLQATTALPSRASSTVTEPSFWRSMIPKPLRKDNHHRSLPAQKQPPKKDWNPATFFICIFLFIGSMSIQQIALRKDYEAFTRQSDARISLLREVVEKLQSGQDVDVEKVLGTGDPEREKEWDEVLKEIEREEATRKRQQAEAAAAAAAQVKADAEAAAARRPAPKSALSSQGFF